MRRSSPGSRRIAVMAATLALVLTACSDDAPEVAEGTDGPADVEAPAATEPPAATPVDPDDAATPTEGADADPTDVPGDDDDGGFSPPDVDITPPSVGGDGDASEEPEEDPTSDATPTEDPSPAGGTGASATLPDEWYADANGNAVPDFLEEELGWDPQEPACAGDIDCGEVQGIDDLAPVDQSVMLVLDASGSMADSVEDGQKMDLAKESVEYFATATPEVVDLGFMVYGHEGSMDPADTEESCEGVEVLGGLGEVDHETVPPMLDEFSPTGFTPIAGALAEAGRQFDGREGGDNRVILVSDGLETCGGDPVAAARQLQASGVEVTIDVIAFDVPTEEQEALQAIAEAGGGEFLTAGSGSELRQRVEDQVGLTWSFLETRGCVIVQRVPLVTCIATSSVAVQRAFDDARRSGDWDDDQEDEIREMADAANAWFQDQSDQLDAATGEQADEYEASLEEARERVREKYGDEVSLTDIRFCWERAAEVNVAAHLPGVG